MFKVMCDNGVPISAAQDGAMYDALGQHKSYVIDGIGNNLQISYNSSSLQVSLASGECVIRGRHITNTASVTLMLDDGVTDRYLVLRYNSSNDSVSFMATSTTTDGNINNGNVTADLILAKVNTSSTGVSSFTDMRSMSSNIFKKYSRVSFEARRSTPSATATRETLGDLCICYETNDPGVTTGWIYFWYCIQSEPSSYNWYLLGKCNNLDSGHYPS